MSDRSGQPPFESPITAPDPAAERGHARVTDRSHLTKVVVRATPATGGGLAPRFGASELVGEALVCGSRPGEWTVIGEAEAVAAAVASAGPAHAVDLTHGRVLLEVWGPAAASALAKVCSLDWTDDMMPDGAVAAGSVAKVTCELIARRDRPDGDGDGSPLVPAYLLAADRSFGQYLHDALVDAAAEFRA